MTALQGREIEEHNMKDNERGMSKWVLIGLFSVIALALMAGGYWFYRNEVQEIRKEKTDNLKAIAGLKVNQIVRWRKERLSDAHLNSEAPFLQMAEF